MSIITTHFGEAEKLSSLGFLLLGGPPGMLPGRAERVNSVSVRSLTAWGQREAWSAGPL